MIQLINIIEKIDNILSDRDYTHKIIIEPNFSVVVHYVKKQSNNLLATKDKKVLQDDLYKKFHSGSISLEEYVVELKKIEDDSTETKFISIEDYILQSLDINRDQYRIEFRAYDQEEFDDKESCVSLIFEGDSTIESLSRPRLNGLFDNNPQKIEGEDIPPVVTFYSYKGGMGRTTTMISYAVKLATQGKRVFIIDCDLEAPGYLNFFDLSSMPLLTKGKINGLIEMVSDIAFSKNCDLSKFDYQGYCLNIAYGNEKYEKYQSVFENIFLMPAGNLNETEDNISSVNRRHYLEGLSRINLSNPEIIKHIFAAFFKYLKKNLHIDLILIDSRTGFSDIIFNSTKYFSKHIVGFFGSNEQSIPGLLNLLDEYYNPNNNFGLTLVNSILPESSISQVWETRFKNVFAEYWKRFSNDETKEKCKIYPLHRNKAYETIGIKHTEYDETKAYLDSIISDSNVDYKNLFNELTLRIFDKPISNNQIIVENAKDNVADKVTDKFEYLNSATTLRLRNNILQNLINTFKRVKSFAEESFAEQSIIDERLFYYRDCMNDLFKQEKFLIQGYKGTGKTYLYLALNNETIWKTLRARAIKKLHDNTLANYTYIPIQVIDTNAVVDKKKFFPFENFINEQTSTKYNFRRFWQLHTWNSVLLEKEFASIRQQSKYSDNIMVIGESSLEFYHRCLSDENFDLFRSIEEDMKKVNDYLKANNKKIFLLYDQLDSRIDPIYWNNVVSPLINYWKDYYNSFSNILPKIFVRTDLMRRIRGTNTLRLENNFIGIEWTINEIFDYFIKLTLTDDFARRCLEIILRQRIKRFNSAKFLPTEESLKDNQYQVVNSNEASLSPYVYAFFGSNVVYNGRYLGNPYKYFGNNLCNADKKSISLRPFIMTLDDNAIRRVLEAPPVLRVKAIIPCEYYANKEVRDTAAGNYFRDLARDKFSEDLLKFKEFLDYIDGDPYRFKTLSQDLYEQLLKTVFEKYQTVFTVVKSPSDLNTILEANGIIAEKITRNGKYYQFAPLYYYLWGLRNSKFDDAEDKNGQEVVGNYCQGRLVTGEIANFVITFDNKYLVKYCDKKFKDNQTVVCSLESEPSLNKNGKLFWYATKLKPINEDQIEG